MALLPYASLTYPECARDTDPILILFFLSPFVVAFVAAILYDIIEPALRRGQDTERSGIRTPPLHPAHGPQSGYHLQLNVLPEGFSLAQILNGLAGYPLFGVVCTGIWSGGWLEDLRKEIRSTEPLQ